AARTVAPAHGFQAAVRAVERGDLGPRQHLDIRLRPDALDEVARHARLEADAARQQPHLPDAAREIDRRLAGRVAGADEDDLLARAISAMPEMPVGKPR